VLQETRQLQGQFERQQKMTWAGKHLPRRRVTEESQVPSGVMDAFAFQSLIYISHYILYVWTFIKHYFVIPRRDCYPWAPYGVGDGSLLLKAATLRFSPVLLELLLLGYVRRAIEHNIYNGFSILGFHFFFLFRPRLGIRERYTKHQA
jgi:hypothetical protein